MTIRDNINDIIHTISWKDITSDSLSTPVFISGINNSFNKYIDSGTKMNIFAGTNITYVSSSTSTTFIFTLNINTRLTATNYSIQFKNTTTTTPSFINSWTNHLQIDPSMCDVSFSLIDTSYNTTGTMIVNVLNNDATIIAAKSLQQSTMLLINPNNNTININAIEDGVASKGKENNITLTVPTGTYSRTTIINTINSLVSQYTQNPINTLIAGSYISIITGSDNKEYTKLRMNINRTYTAKDYNLVFYDPFSFVKCYAGVTSVRNTTWDSTLGWILGFHKYTIYYLADIGGDGEISLTSDTVVNTNLYNYFMLCLDDYNQNHLNDGLITITGKDLDIPLPSYANRTNFQCDPATGQSVYNPSTIVSNSRLTQNQLYSITQISNSAKSNTITTDNVVSTKKYGKSYGTGPFVTDVFGIIPMKIAGLTPGASFIEYGGTLQNQDRTYFGPVNIRRMSVKLVSDRGDVVDLTNANWSFSLICESLNKLNPTPK